MDELYTLVSDEVILTRLSHVGTNKIAVYKWRKGLSKPNPAENDLLLDIVIEQHIDVLRARNKIEYDITYDPENPPYDHFGFKDYEERFLKDAAEHGLEDAYWMWSVGHACGCMGRSDGEPFCPCRMRILTAKKHVSVEFKPKTPEAGA